MDKKTDNKEQQKPKITFRGELWKNAWLYLLLAVVFGLCFYVSLEVDLKIISQAIIALPGGAAAVGLIVQIIRDNESHKRNLELQKNDHGFSLAFTSYMSEFVFKKHGDFCEEYMAELFKIKYLFSLRDIALIKKEAEQFANTLFKIRAKYSVWLNLDKQAKYNFPRFELSLRNLHQHMHQDFDLNDIEFKSDDGYIAKESSSADTKQVAAILDILNGTSYARSLYKFTAELKAEFDKDEKLNLLAIEDKLNSSAVDNHFKYDRNCENISVGEKSINQIILTVVQTIRIDGFHALREKALDSLMYEHQ